MKILILLLVTLLFSHPSSYADGSFKLPTNEAFVPVNHGFDQGTYIAIPLKLDAFAAAYANAQAAAGSKLKNRGEAHMTVVTPPEMQSLDKSSRAKFLEQLNGIDWTQKIITPICLGRGFSDLDGQRESTYFIVVDSPAVNAVREKFGLKHFFPHITLGFSKRDLHFEDGVVKDRKSCF